MRIKHIENLQRLNQHLVKLSKRKNIYLLSFDIFDTIVFRKVPDTTIIHASSNWLMDQLGISDKTTEYAVEARNRAYETIAKANQQPGSDACASLEEFALQWIYNLTGYQNENFAGLAENLVQFEINLECRMSYVEPATVALLNKLQQEYRLVYCSDMYLSKKLIDRLLEFHGLKNVFSAGYVSSDLRKFKWSGKLFKQMIKEEQLFADSIIHIGDNSYSDAKIALRNKLNVVLVENSFNQKRNKLLLDQHNGFRKNQKHSAIFADLVCRQGVFNIKDDKQALGFNVVGPMFTGFVLNLCEIIKQERLEKIYFVARDGLIFKKIYDLISPSIFKNQNPPQSYYLKISRQSVFAATQKSIDHKTLKHWIKQNEGEFTLMDLLKRYGLEEEFIISIAEKNNFKKLDQPLDLQNIKDENIKDFLNNNILNLTVSEIADHRKHNLHLYLNKEHFFSSDKVAMVDIGWSGSTQGFLYDIFGKQKNFPQVHGYYFALKQDAHNKNNEKNLFKAIISNEQQNGFFSSSAFSFLHCLELLCSAPHGTVISYNENGDPQFMSDTHPIRIAEKRNDRTIDKIHYGTLLYAEKFSEVYSILDFTSDQLVPFVRTMLHRIARHPSDSEASLLLSLEFSENFGRESSNFLGADLSSKNIVERVKALLNKEHKKASWGRGVIESYKIPLIGNAYSIGSAYRLMASQDSQPAKQEDAIETLSGFAEYLTVPKFAVKENSLLKVNPLQTAFTNKSLAFFEMERIALNQILNLKRLNTYKKDGL